MSGFKGVTRYLRRARNHVVSRDAWAPAIDVIVPEGVVVVLPAVEVQALDWEAPPTVAERKRISVVPGSVTPTAPGTVRASKKKSKGRR